MGAIHQWTNGGDEVLVVRFVDKDGKSASKRLKDGVPVDADPFQHPMTVGETVTAPDWDPRTVCGGGIHGWPWGMSLGDGKDPDWNALWQVYGVKPEDIVLVGSEGKVKFRIGVLRFLGAWNKATEFVLSGQMAWVHASSSGAASAAGDRGAASATGYSGAASATGSRGAASATGDSGAASATGDSGAASATGDSGAASAAGDSGAASATGYRGAASATGKCTVATVSGIDGKAMAGEGGAIALAWWNKKLQRAEMRCSRTGKGCKCKADVWYRLNAAGEFIKVKEQ
jgi:hypothetical protein